MLGESVEREDDFQHFFLTKNYGQRGSEGKSIPVETQTAIKTKEVLKLPTVAASVNIN